MNKKTSLSNNIYQKPQKNQQYQEKTINKEKDTHEVRQDGYASPRFHLASSQAVRAGKGARTRQIDTNYPRSKKRSTVRQTEHLAIWAPRPIMLDVDRAARDLRLTRSRAGLHLIKLGLSHNLFDGHLKEILDLIREANAEATRKNQKPYRDNLYRSAYYSAQDRTLLTNILHLLLRLLQEPPETMQRIIGQSQQDAKNALTFLSPDIADLIRQKHGKEEELNTDGEGQG